MEKQSIGHRNLHGDWDLQDNSLRALIARWEIPFSNLPLPFCSLRPKSYNIGFNPRMRSRAGVCWADESRIELNPHILKSPVQLEETLVHEMCHLAIFRRWPRAQTHGRKWKALMGLLGFNPERCHRLEVPKRHRQRRWQLLCKCKTHNVSTVVFNRIKRGIKYKCVDCQEILKNAPI